MTEPSTTGCAETDTIATAAMDDVVSSIESLYVGLSLYESAHPVTSTLSVNTADTLAQFADSHPGNDTITLGVGPLSFIRIGTEDALCTNSSLSQTLHRLGATALRIDSHAQAEPLVKAFDAIRHAIRDDLSFDELMDRVTTSSKGAVEIRPVDVSGASVRRVSMDGSGERELMSSSSLAALLDTAVPSCGCPIQLARATETALRDAEPGAHAELSDWLIRQSRGLRTGSTGAHDDERMNWLQQYVRALSPDIRGSILEFSSEAKHGWFTNASELSPVWPVHEMLDALEEVDQDSRRVSGTARLLFRRLGSMTLSDETNRRRLEKIAEEWSESARENGAEQRGMSDAIESLLADAEEEEYTPQAYARRLDDLSGEGKECVRPWSITEISDTATIAEQTAEIALELSDELTAHDADAAQFARTISNIIPSLVARHRFDLITKVLRRIRNGLESKGSFAGEECDVLIAAINDSGVIDALLVNADRPDANRPEMIEILNLVSDVAASHVVARLCEAPSEQTAALLIRWLDDLDERVRTRTICERVVVSPGDARKLAPLVASTSTGLIEDIIASSLRNVSGKHRIALYALMLRAQGPWSAHTVRRALVERYAEARRIALAGCAQDWDPRFARDLVEFTAKALLNPESDIEEIRDAVSVLVEHAEGQSLDQLARLLRDLSWDAGAIAAGRAGMLAELLASRRSEPSVARASAGGMRAHFARSDSSRESAGMQGARAMLESINEAMKRVQGAAGGRTHLGERHPAVIKRLDEATELFRAALQTRDSIVLYFFSDRVVFENLTLGDSRELIAGIGEQMRLLGSDALVLHSGLQASDLQQLLATLESGAEVEPPPGCARRFEFSRVSVLESDDALAMQGAVGTDPQALASPAGDLSRTWQRLQQGEVLDVSAIERSVAGILTSHQLLPGSLIDLIKIKDHDEYTLAHTVNVAILSSALGQCVGIGGRGIEDLTTAALLHDIGKQFVPGEVLRKPGALDDQERLVVERHPSDGARLLLGRSDVPPLAAIVAYEHHRRIDGGGYPHRSMTGPPNLASQIVHICDVFDALCTHRPYRAGMPMTDALSIMNDLTRKAFDRSLFEVFSEEIAQRVPDRPMPIKEPPLRRAA